MSSANLFPLSMIPKIPDCRWNIFLLASRSVALPARTCPDSWLRPILLHALFCTSWEHPEHDDAVMNGAVDSRHPSDADGTPGKFAAEVKVDRTLALDKPDHSTHREPQRNYDQPLHVVRYQVPPLNPTLLLSGQVAE